MDNPSRVGGDHYVPSRIFYQIRVQLIMSPQRMHLWIAQVAMALGAVMTHYIMHPPHHGITYFWGTAFPAMDLCLVSGLFLSTRTAVWGMLLNSFLAFFGIIMMTDLIVVAALQGWIKTSFWDSPLRWLMESMFPNVMMAVADFFVGLGLYKVTITERTGVTGKR